MVFVQRLVVHATDREQSMSNGAYRLNPHRKSSTLRLNLSELNVSILLETFPRIETCSSIIT